MSSPPTVDQFLYRCCY